ncbi:MAG: phosphate butyryltransferase [Candidatus Cloacimonetes bacterium HGW-Cloacimonetes-1]|jgi:phosphate butyryltransferase|nr:MAG: phosphate butyryltransferase [Candidatus Cloacimonetes bacterium HGW-Cloacimonetes-1]
MPITKLDQMFDFLKSRPKKRLVAAYANDAHTISAVHTAINMGIVDGILTGDEALINKTCTELGINPADFTIIHEPNPQKAAAKAVSLINDGSGDFLMKGLISTDIYMKAMLNKETGLLDPGAILSHVTVIEPTTYHKLLIIGDVAIIPLPDLKQKIAITNYLIKTAHFLGIEMPKLGILAASEQTLPKIPSCYDAALISKMAERGQIRGAMVEGPLGFDLLVDKESAEIKGVKSEVCGDVDCILFPNIECGNTFYKTMTKLMKAELGAIVMGARVPAVLSSRGDSEKSKLYSIALAAMLVQ